MSMATQGTNSANASKVSLLDKAVADMLAEALRRGFHGTASVELTIQDGTIQQIRRRIDRVEK